MVDEELEVAEFLVGEQDAAVVLSQAGPAPPRSLRLTTQFPPVPWPIFSGFCATSFQRLASNRRSVLLGGRHKPGGEARLHSPQQPGRGSEKATAGSGGWS